MYRSLVVSLALLFLASAAVASQPALYVVFEFDRDDAVRLVSADEVRLAEELPASVQSFAASEDPRRVDVTLRDAHGAAVYRTSVQVERYLRAEFPSLDGAHEIDGRWLERERVAFAVRLPMTGDRIEVATARAHTAASFDVPRMTRAAAAASDAPSTNRVDILVLGDGYMASEEEKFKRDVERVTGELLSIAPYSTYRNFVKIRSHFVASKESGADHPKCSDGGRDPLEGKVVDTAFDATFCTSGIHRLLTVNSAKVYMAARDVPEWDKLLVIVNDSTYGGAGGDVSVTSTHQSAVLVAQHEYGHSFTGLADEYTTPYPGFPNCSDEKFEGCEPNVTDVKSRAAIKWLPWIKEATAIPTFFNGDQSVLGLFEGARYKNAGFFRPKNDCAMNSLGSPFCEICAQAYVLRLYRGWGGMPFKGIDLIEPGSESHVPGTIVARAGEAIPLRVTLLAPEGRDAIAVRWYVDGVMVDGATSNEFTYVAASGRHVVELRVSDTAGVVHPQMTKGALEKKRTWIVEAPSGPVPPRRRAVGRR